MRMDGWLPGRLPPLIFQLQPVAFDPTEALRQQIEPVEQHYIQANFECALRFWVRLPVPVLNQAALEQHQWIIAFWPKTGPL